MINEVFLLQNSWRKTKEFPFEFKDRSIFRTLVSNIENELIIGLTGSRQTGKSSLMYMLIKHLLDKGINKQDVFYFNLDDFYLHKLFSRIEDFVKFINPETFTKKYVFIDEIQRFDNPGLFLKQIYDLKLNIKVIYSGSSQLEIKSKVKEHLVGRSREFIINRLSFKEYLDFAGPITQDEALKSILLYGSYPAVALEHDRIEKILKIKDIVQAYVQKDIVEYLKIGEVDVFNKFISRLANQIGDLLNINSLCNSLGLKRNQAKEYINVLESTFVAKRIFPFHKNYNKEITKTPKLYFMDTGIRNFLINNFNELSLRNDKGVLFENFIFNELQYKDFNSLSKINFWRTSNKSEIDFIVSDFTTTEAIEVKWQKSSQPKVFSGFNKIYPEINTKLITVKSFISEGL